MGAWGGAGARSRCGGAAIAPGEALGDRDGPGSGPRPTSEPEQIQEFWLRLMQLDWRPLLQDLTDRGGAYGWERSRAVAALADYHQFLLLHFLWPEDALAVSADADAVWHLHILDTRRYGPDCQWLFGHFLHHIPRVGRQGDRDRLEQGRQRAVQRLRDRAMAAAAAAPAAARLLKGDWATTACILSRTA